MKKYLDLPLVFLINLFVKHIDKSIPIRKNEFFAGRIITKFMDKTGFSGVGFHYAWFHPKYEPVGIPSHLRKHELWHLEQQRWVPLLVFLTKYVFFYLKGRMKGLSHRDAYLAIPYEVEARDRAGPRNG